MEGSPYVHIHPTSHALPQDPDTNPPTGASGIAYASIITCILAARYLDVIRWGFKLSYMALGATVAAEVAGKMLLNNGLTSQLRPRRYHQVSRETIDTMLGDFGELVNFFFVEAQRVLYCENIGASAAVGFPQPFL
ncbi:reticulon family protein [Candidatus Bathyarchaeota archaeon]|nr:reticulon family protein [Candidatus Bathyarchaeota archaeon]